MPAPPPSTNGPPGLGTGPSTPGGGGPSAPGPSPSGPGTSGGGPVGPGAPPPSQPSTPDLGEVDVASWELWWHYDRHRWLDVRSRFAQAEVATGSDDFFLGRGATPAADRLMPSRERLAGALVPLLTRTLAGESSPDILGAAVVALAKCGELARAQPPAPGAIAAALTHGNVEVAESAAIAIGILGANADTELLVHLVRGDSTTLRARWRLDFDQQISPRVRAFAAYGIAAAAPELDAYARLVLVNTLADALAAETRARGSHEVMAACLTAIGHVELPLGAEHERLEPVLHDTLATTLQQVEFLMAAARAPAAVERVHAAAVAGVARAGGRLPPGCAARRALVQRWVEILTERSTERLVRRAAIASSPALAHGTLEDGRALCAALRTVTQTIADSPARARAWIALGECSGLGRFDPERDEGLGMLIEGTAKAPSPLRPWAALGLGLQQRLRAQRGHPHSTDAGAVLQEALRESRSAYTTSAFALALGLGGREGDAEIVGQALERTSEPGARGYLCLSLALLGQRSARATIAGIALQARAQPALLSNCALALGLLGGRDELTALAALFSTSNSTTTQAGLASAFALLGDARAIDPLLELARDTQRPQQARAFAFVALGGIADPREQVWNCALLAGTDFLSDQATLVSALDGRGVLDIL